MVELQKRIIEAEQCEATLASTRTWVADNFALATPVQPEPAWWQTWPAQVLIVLGAGVVGGLVVKATGP
jgi:hypothetical protein